MTTETRTRSRTRRWSQRSTRGRRLASALLTATVLTACAGSDAGTTTPATDSIRAEQPSPATDDHPETTDVSPTDVAAAEVVGGEETRSALGPRALDLDAGMMMVVDSIDVSGDDIFIRLRVVNGSGDFLNMGVQNTWYGPLLELRDDRGNTYAARAVEPDGVERYSVGRLRLRLEGPFDPDADEFVVELATERGPLITDPIAAPSGDVVRWWNESPPVALSDPVVGDHDGRTVQVVGITDRGTHLDVSIEASDASTGFTVPDDASATLTLADGTELTSLPLDPMDTQRSDAFSGVLRFLGTLPTGSTVMSLDMAGVDVEIPLDCADAACPTESPETKPSFAPLPVLPDLLHQIRTTDPLPTSTITIGSE